MGKKIISQLCPWTLLFALPLLILLTSGEFASWLAAGSRSRGFQGGAAPLVAGQDFMPRPRRGGTGADEARRPLEGVFPSRLTQGLTPAASSQKESASWEIQLVLETHGSYKLEERDARYSGQYSFTVFWKGSIERDNGDYILYHYSNDLLHWEAQETARLPEIIKTLTTLDFLDKPYFKLNYILNRENMLHFDFLVEGFLVPQNASSENFYLRLPSSKENSTAFSEVNYNFYVSRGSNKVAIEEKKIYLGPVEKNFSWTWKHQQWLERESGIIFTSNGHEVKVRITVTPHQARG